MTDRTKVVRHADRARYDIEAVHEVLDGSLVCQVAFIQDGQPFNVPMLFARSEDTLFLHASTKSRIYNELKSGIEVCIAATLVDGIVLAKSAYSSSMNYRSAMIFGKMTPVTDEEKMKVAELITEKIAPGRWNDCRRPYEKELNVTGFLKMPISKFSVKIRTGPPIDDPDDLDLPYWSGVVPVSLVRGSPITASTDSGKPEVPGYVSKTQAGQ